MKKRPVFLGALLAFGLVFAGCPTDGDGGGNNGGPSFLGNTLELSGQVYLFSATFTNNILQQINYRNFNGNLTIFDDYGGSGEIKNGKLSYSIGIPNELETFNYGWGDLFTNNYYYDNVQVSNKNVKGRVLTLSVDSDNYYGVSKGNITYTIRDNSVSSTQEMVAYVYVENDVTVSGEGRTETFTNTYYTPEDGAPHNITSTITTKNFNLALKAGWNAVYQKIEGSGTFTGTIDNPTSVNSTQTNTMSLSNPSLKWLMQERDPEDY